MELIVKDIEWIDLALEPDVHCGGIDEKLDGLVSAGRPFIADALEIAKSANQDPDPELAIQCRTHHFYYLRFPLNIRPKNDRSVGKRKKGIS